MKPCLKSLLLSIKKLKSIFLRRSAKKLNSGLFSSFFSKRNLQSGTYDFKLKKYFKCLGWMSYSATVNELPLIFFFILTWRDITHSCRWTSLSWLYPGRHHRRHHSKKIHHSNCCTLNLKTNNLHAALPPRTHKFQKIEKEILSYSFCFLAFWHLATATLDLKRLSSEISRGTTEKKGIFFKKFKKFRK